jgi:4-hydroxy-tetrahydrodipicolinate reductase
MEIALIGYGRMGRTIEALGKDQGHSFPLIIDLDNRSDLNSSNLQNIDVAIEFTIPSSAPDNISACLEHRVPVVSGTTGWNDRLTEVESYARKQQGAFFYASNFSIGVNILFALNKQLAKIMDRFSSYKVSMEEVHHIYKLDQPSGTAITLAQQIKDQQRGVTRWSLEDDGNPFTLHIDVKREGEVKGIHTVKYESNLDSITLIHNAKSRDAFAAGALMAAEFIRDKSGIYGMKDLLKI